MKQSNEMYSKNRSPVGQQDLFFEAITNTLEIIVKGVLKILWFGLKKVAKSYKASNLKASKVGRIRNYYLNRNKA